MDEGQGRRDTQVSGRGGTGADPGAPCVGTRGGARRCLGAAGVRGRAGGGDVMVAEPVSHYGEYEERDGGFELVGEQRDGEPPPRGRGRLIAVALTLAVMLL